MPKHVVPKINLASILKSQDPAALEKEPDHDTSLAKLKAEFMQNHQSKFVRDSNGRMVILSQSELFSNCLSQFRAESFDMFAKHNDIINPAQGEHDLSLLSPVAVEPPFDPSGFLVTGESSKLKLNQYNDLKQAELTSDYFINTL